MALRDDKDKIEITIGELRAIVRDALRPAMERRGVSRDLDSEGDFYVVVTPPDAAAGAWRLRVGDSHGGDDYAHAEGATLWRAVRWAIDAINGDSVAVKLSKYVAEKAAALRV